MRGTNTPRETIVKYCDVCFGQPEMVGHQDKVLAVIKVAQDIPGYGEQKVCMC